jgi:putative ABC transport system permease protein
LAGSLLLVGGYQFGAVEHMIDVQYRLVQRMDTHLTFHDPTPERAIAELRHAPGVYYAEGYRSVPVRLSAGSRDYQTSILGMDTESRLRGLIDGDYRPVRLPPDGILMTRYLADFLGVEPGERISVELLEGARRTVEVPLAGTVDEPLGVSAYMERRALNRLLREGPAVNGAWLLVEESRQADLFSRLWEMSRIAGIGMMVEAERGIREHLTDTILVFMSILLLLAGSIAFAVVYNNARIALAERTRELATLRVLGFTRGEIGWILIGEIGILTLAALPVGWLTGTLFAFLLSEAMSVDMYRIPFVITPWTYAFSAAGVLLASVLSVLLIARRIRDIDMVSALKAAE